MDLLVYSYFCPVHSPQQGGVQQTVGPLLKRLAEEHGWNVSVLHPGTCPASNHQRILDEHSDAREQALNPTRVTENARLFQSEAADHDVVLSTDRVLPASISNPCILMSNAVCYTTEANAARAGHWDRITAPTEYYAEQIQVLNPFTKVTAVPVGLPADFIEKAQSSPPAPWDNEGKITIRLPHRPDPRKGHREAIRGLAAAGDGADHVELRISWFDEEDSTPDYRQELENLSHELGVSDQVVFDEWLDSNAWEKARQKTSATLALGEFTETFGLSIIESVLYGRPVVVCNQPATREIVGDSEFYISIDDPHNWYHHLLDFFENPPSRADEPQIQRRIRQTLSIERMAQRYNQLLCKVSPSVG